MAKRKRSLRDLTRAFPETEDEHAVILEEIQTGNDRATAILLASQVQSGLCTLVLEKLDLHGQEDVAERLYEREAPLSTFFSQTSLAWALGVITQEEVRQLDHIRHIRNAFAHSALAITFNTTEIAKECRRLSDSIIYEGQLVEFSSANDTKARFLIHCLVMAQRLSERAVGLIDHKKLDLEREEQRLSVLIERREEIIEKLQALLDNYRARKQES